MSYQAVTRNLATVEMIRRLSEQRSSVERCQFCRIPIVAVHRHVLELENRRMICACNACAKRYQYLDAHRFKLIPRGVRYLEDFNLPESLWDAFALPINLAFFYRETSAGKAVALYPTQTGATESPLPIHYWEQLEEPNPELAEMEPDVEALLVNRVGGARDYFVTPMDACYELVGIMRLRWRGLSGGESMWQEIDRFFTTLREQAKSNQLDNLEMTHA